MSVVVSSQNSVTCINIGGRVMGTVGARAPTLTDGGQSPHKLIEI